MTTPNSGAVVTLSLAGFLASLPAGIQPAPFILGLMFSGAGIAMRAGSEIQKASEGNEGIKLSKIAGWIFGGFFSAPGVTLVYLIGLNIAGYPADVPRLFFLIPLSFFGQKATIWLMQTVTQAAKGIAGGLFKGFPDMTKGDGK